VAIWYILWVAIWYILWPYGIFYGHLKNFSRFGMLYQEKSGSLGWRANVFFYVCTRNIAKLCSDTQFYESFRAKSNKNLQKQS
jgi:hypothetical protein